MPKILTTLVLASMVVLPLVACSSPAEASCNPTAAGPHSSKVKVSGDFGKEPKVTMPPAFDSTETERSVVVSGKGTAAVEGDLVTAHYGAYDAATGKIIQLDQGVTWSELTFSLVKAKMLPGLYKSLKCAQQGDRIVSAMPPADLFQGTDMTAAGIGATDTLVFIFDVSKVEPAAAPSASPTPSVDPSSGPVDLPTPTAWTQDVPTVSLTGAAPVVTLPSTTPRPDLELKVIAAGTGAEVTATSTVTVDYQGISWNSGKIFDQSYAKGQPFTSPVNGVIPGFGAAMVGQKVGATVLVTIPPRFAYGEGAINGNNLVGQTLVFLIQIHDVK